MLFEAADCLRAVCAVRDAGIGLQDAVLTPFNGWNSGRRVSLITCKHWVPHLILDALKRGSPGPEFVFPSLEQGFKHDPTVYAADVWSQWKVNARQQRLRLECGLLEHPSCCLRDQKKAMEVFHNPVYGIPEGSVKYFVEKNDDIHEWFGTKSGGCAGPFRTDKLLDGKPRHLHFVLPLDFARRMRNERKDLEKVARVYMIRIPVPSGAIDRRLVNMFVLTHKQADSVPLISAVPAIAGASPKCYHAGIARCSASSGV